MHCALQCNLSWFTLTASAAVRWVSTNNVCTIKTLVFTLAARQKATVLVFINYHVVIINTQYIQCISHVFPKPCKSFGRPNIVQPTFQPVTCVNTNCNCNSRVTLGWIESYIACKSLRTPPLMGVINTSKSSIFTCLTAARTQEACGESKNWCLWQIRVSALIGSFPLDKLPAMCSENSCWKEEIKNELWSDFTKPPVSPVSSTSIDLSCDLHLFRISIGEHIFLEDMLLAMFFFFF